MEEKYSLGRLVSDEFSSSSRVDVVLKEGTYFQQESSGGTAKSYPTSYCWNPEKADPKLTGRTVSGSLVLRPYMNIDSRLIGDNERKKERDKEYFALITNIGFGQVSWHGHLIQFDCIETITRVEV